MLGKRFFFITIVLILIKLPVYSNTINVPDDYSKIQDAINAANAGDIVKVSYGEYDECITMKDGVDLIGIEDKERGKPLIRCPKASNVTLLAADNCKIEGLYLTKKLPDSEVILCNSVSPEIKNCLITGGTEGVDCTWSAAPEIRFNVITGNLVVGVGCYNGSHPLIFKNFISNSDAGISCIHNSYPNITQNIITKSKIASIYCINECSPYVDHNDLFCQFDGFYCMGKSNPKISFNRIFSCTETGVFYCALKSPDINNNNIFDCYLSGMIFHGLASPRVFNNSIVDCVEAGISFFNESNSEIMNNIIFNSRWGILIDESIKAKNAYIAYNDLWQISDYKYFVNGIGPFNPTPGKGEMSKHPRFNYTEKCDFRLQPVSPCIDKGNPDSESNDPDDSRNDMGAYGGPDSGWVGSDYFMDIGSYHKSPKDEDFFKTDSFIPGSNIDLKMQFQNRNEITVDLYIYLVTSIGKFYYPNWTTDPIPIHLTIPGGLIEIFQFLNIQVPEDQPPGKFALRWYSINTDMQELVFPEMEYEFKIAPKPL